MSQPGYGPDIFRSRPLEAELRSALIHYHITTVLVDVDRILVAASATTAFSKHAKANIQRRATTGARTLFSIVPDLHTQDVINENGPDEVASNRY